ncbi:MAG TPA: flap endonuclease-1 [Candidatus Glassbacteria bacterium]|nr:flap endonuclease-1 [Candidatus Glassbacteria bacterium]
MGIKLREILPKTSIKLENLGGKTFAIDAYNALYQFLAIIRQPDGTPLKDRSGKVTSHLSGLLYRTSKLLELGIKPIYVFDGTPPALKEAEIKRRSKVKEEALVKYEKAIKEGKIEEARKYAQATSRLKDYMQEDSKKLLSLMGLPWIQAPSEGEAQAAYLTKKGDADYCASQDYDSLLFGTPKLIRNVTISGRRKIARKNSYINVSPEIVELKKILAANKITFEQLIDLSILIGTDFNPMGIKGLGPKTALKLIKEHGTIAKVLPHVKNNQIQFDPQEIKEIFINPKITDDYVLKWKDVDIDGVIDFLCRKKDFSEERVNKALIKIQEGSKGIKEKTTLEQWFG